MDLRSKLFVGGLSWHTSVATLRSYFEQYGPVADLILMIDQRSGKPRGFAFVTMTFLDDAARILDKQAVVIDGRRVDIKRALPRDVAPNRSGCGKIFVGGLTPSTGDAELVEHFSQFGPVSEGVVMIDRVSGHSRGFGFVTFRSVETMERAVHTRHAIQGKRVDVRPAEARRPDRGEESPAGGPQRSSETVLAPGSCSCPKQNGYCLAAPNHRVFDVCTLPHV